MNLHLVTLPGKCRRYCGTGQEARQYREIFMQEFGVKKKEVLVQPAVVPTQKIDLIAYLNALAAEIDAAGGTDAR